MRKVILYKVASAQHGDLIAVKNNGDVSCFKHFKDAWAEATNVIDAEKLGEIDLIEVHGPPPGIQSVSAYTTADKDAICKDLWYRSAFKEDK